ncbi:kinase [Sphingomonas sp. BT-65]|uniref:kinase n=1 Tax=Sphingomonas sp. BT-65 TaxID=2989821 RepID=UPI002235A7B2|nr:kinase [Sphingomonas sp. BT-65]MCW4462790.1 kinase [Sphingomonas sp. BT-65]
MTASLEIVAQAASVWLEASPRPLILGICGSQGSGKSTLARGLVERLGVRAAILSLDDLYLSRALRADLAREVHPLLATRGVPLTHDVALGCAILDEVKAGRPVRLPRFDKASDEPLPETQWQPVDAPLDLLIFEGWCVGAAAQHASERVEPINDLEREHDADGRWRRAVNAALAGPYQALFARIDRLVLLAAPGFEVVRDWRAQQEAELRATLAAVGRDPALAMTDAQVARFIQHYERITRAILDEMPGRADLTLRLDPGREVIGKT